MLKRYALLTLAVLIASLVLTSTLTAAQLEGFYHSPAYTDFDLTVMNLTWGTGQPYRYERYVIDETHNLAALESGDVMVESDTFAKR